ncbi:MAG: hypothetical protein DME57_04975 [Verrucomicrobia bacterium]|nr:MAG: hypothetical protein DME57_04975 [Verrucomicrobiota bacterium]
MNKRLSLVAAVTVVALFAGCAMFRETPQSSLVGTWTNQLGTVWALKADGKFEVALNNSDRPSIWGKYSVSGDTLTIKESRGSHTPKSCRGEAVYQFNRDRDTLTFTKVSDKCKLREKNLMLPWKPWKGK